MSTTSLLWDAAHRPQMVGATGGICRLCSESGSGQPFDAWVKSTFMDRDKLHGGEIICHACQFSCTDHSAELAALTGKSKLQRMRNYSHFVVAGEWLPASKGNKELMADILLHRQPEVAVIAVSGQKHIIFRAQAGWWQIEEQGVRPFPAELAAVLADVALLYNGAISKTEIETGRYIHKRVMEFGLSAWRVIENRIRPLRGSMRLQLALFLAQREAEEDDGSVSDGDSTVDPAVAGDPQRVQEQIPAQYLAAVRGQSQERGLHGDAESLRQQSLFAAADQPAGG